MPDNLEATNISIGAAGEMSLEDALEPADTDSAEGVGAKSEAGDGLDAGNGVKGPEPAPEDPSGDGTTDGASKGQTTPLSWALKGVDSEHVERLKSQKLLNGNNEVDANKLLRNYGETMKYNTESNQAMAILRNQLGALHQKMNKPDSAPRTIEDIRKDFDDKAADFRAVAQWIGDIVSGRVPEENRARVLNEIKAWSETMYQKHESDFQREQNDFTKAAWIRELEESGRLQPVSGAKAEMDESSLIARSSENVLAALPDKEKNDVALIGKYIGNPETLGLLNNLAAVLYPDRYGIGENVGKSKLTAVRRVLAENPDVAKAIVSLSRKSAMADRIPEIERENYERGKADALKPPPAKKPPGAAVKGNVKKDIHDDFADTLSEI